MRLACCSIAFMIATTAISAMPQTKSVKPHPFESTECGFRLNLVQGWKVKRSGSKSCAFTVVDPHRSMGPFEITVRKDTVKQGEADLGFTLENQKWVLKGEQSADAEGIDSSTWTGLIGTIPIHNQSSAYETRALLTDRKGRIAEIVGKLDEANREAFVDQFEFLPAATSQGSTGGSPSRSAS